LDAARRPGGVRAGRRARRALCSGQSVYLDYYGLTEPPFDITPNPRFLFYSAKHREAFNHLLYGIRERKGFVQLTGEVGAGKTTLCRAILEQLDGRCSTALIFNPVMSADELMKAIATEFGLNVRGLDRLETVAALNEFLLRQVEQGRESVLIIDEAQDLTDDLLEQVRLLSNLETDDRKLLQIVLLGQPELRERLDHPRLRQLRQRITVRYHLEPLSHAEVCRYVEHRLHVSGANGTPCFTRAALWRVHRYSRGIPRLVNAVCDKALLAGYVHQTDRITHGLVGLAIRELEGNIQP
jgi:general secretion pathway protein A